MKMNKSINDEILKILNKVGISGDISRITVLDEDYLTVVLFRLPVNEGNLICYTEV